MLLNLLLLMEFMKNVFTNFLVENLFSHEVLVTGRVTAIKIKLNFVSSYKLKKIGGAMQVVSTPCEAFLCQRHFIF